MRRSAIPRLLWAGPLTAVIAGTANLLYFLVTKSLGEPYLLPLDATGSRQAPMPALLPVLAAVIVGLLAALFFGLLLRYARKPVIVFVSVVVTALILSFGASFDIPGAGMRTKLFLSGLNVLTAVIVAGGLILFMRGKGFNTKFANPDKGHQGRRRTTRMEN